MIAKMSSRLAALAFAFLALASLARAQDPTDAQSAFLDIELLPATQTISGNVVWTFLSTASACS